MILLGFARLRTAPLPFPSPVFSTTRDEGRSGRTAGASNRRQAAALSGHDLAAHHAGFSNGFAPKTSPSRHCLSRLYASPLDSTTAYR